LAIVFLATFILFTQLISITPVLADANDTVTIDVNVTEAASIVVIPDTLNWTNAATGQPGGVKYLTVKNAGSLNVSQIYAYIDTLITESARPYGSGNPLAFSAGGVITLKNETDSTYYFAGRIEWNWTQDIPNHNWVKVDNADARAWGYFRNTSSDYVWVLGNGTEGLCNETGAQFALEYDVDLGTAATREPEGPYSRDAGDANWSYFSINDASSPLDGYCVAAWWDCTKIYIYHYDMRTTAPYDFDTCNNAAYLHYANLTSGNTITLEADAWVSLGYPAGWLNQTTLTVHAWS
jgi:hypothetical protein